MKTKKIQNGMLWGMFAVLSFSLTTAGTVYAKVENLSGILTEIQSYMTKIVPLLLGFAVIAFLYKTLMYIYNADDEGKREEFRSFVLYGIIGLAVMVSVWGLVHILTGTFGFQNPVVPHLPTAGEAL